MSRNINMLILLGFFVFSVSLAEAGVTGMSVAVNGMSCPFCAYGVEKRLKTVNGVARVVVDMKTGSAAITAGEALSIHYQEVPQAVKDAGFTAGVMRVTVDGTIAVGEEAAYFMVFDGQSLFILPGNHKMAARLDDLARSEKKIVLQGVLTKKGADSWGVSPEYIQEIIP